MNIIIYNKNLEIPEEFKKLINDKFNKLAKIIGQVISFRVDLSQDPPKKKGRVFRVEVNLTIPEKMFRLVEYDYDLLTSVVKVRDKLARQIVEHKRILIDRKRLV